MTTAFLFLTGWQTMLPFVALQATTLGANPYTVGLIMGASGVVPLVLALPIGLTTERAGAGAVMLAACIAGSMGLLLMAAGRALSYLTLGLIIFGVAQLAVATSTQVATLLTAFPDTWDKTIGFYYFAASLGQVFGPVIGGLLARNSNYAAAFVGAAVITTSAALTSVIQIRQKPAKARLLVRPPFLGTVVGALRQNPVIATGLFSSFAAELIAAFWYAFFPILLLSRGYEVALIAFYFSLRGISTTAVRPLLGMLTARISRTRVLLGSVVMLALAVALMPLQESRVGIGFAVLLFGISTGIAFPTTMAVVSEGFPTEAAEVGISLRLFMTRIGQVIGPALLGLVAQSVGLTGAFYASAAILSGTVLVHMAALASPLGRGEGK